MDEGLAMTRWAYYGIKEETMQRLTDDEFIEVWNTSQSVREVISKTGLAKAADRAWKLRRKGREVKRFEPTSKLGEARGEGVMVWLKANYPEVYREWKEFSKNGRTDQPATCIGHT